MRTCEYTILRWLSIGFVFHGADAMAQSCGNGAMTMLQGSGVRLVPDDPDDTVSIFPADLPRVARTGKHIWKPDQMLESNADSSANFLFLDCGLIATIESDSQVGFPSPRSDIGLYLRLASGAVSVRLPPTSETWCMIEAGGPSYVLTQGGTLRAHADGTYDLLSGIGYVYRKAVPERDKVVDQGRPVGVPDQVLGENAEGRTNTDQRYLQMAAASASQASDGWIGDAEQGDLIPSRSQSGPQQSSLVQQTFRTDVEFEQTGTSSPITGQSLNTTPAIGVGTQSVVDRLLEGRGIGVAVAARVRRTRIIGAGSSLSRPGSGSLRFNPEARRNVRINSQ